MEPPTPKTASVFVVFLFKCAIFNSPAQIKNQCVGIILHSEIFEAQFRT